MYNLIFQAHSGWRWIVLLVIIITTVKVLLGWLTAQNWSKLDTLLVRLANVALSIQVVLGIILYIMFLTQGRPEVGRFTGEHVFPAFLSLGGTGFALSRSRKATKPRTKFMVASFGMIITIVLIYIALLRVGGIFA
jgi:hypothetical protein